MIILGTLTLFELAKALATPIFNKTIQNIWEKRVVEKLFPKDTFNTELVGVIYKTIDEFEKLHPYDKRNGKFPFYHSQIFFEHLSLYVLFDEENFSKIDIEKVLSENSNIIKPSQQEILDFYELFRKNSNANETLKNLFIEENYKERIFKIDQSIISIECKVDEIKKDTSVINETLDKLTKLAFQKTMLKPIQQAIRVSKELFINPSYELTNDDYYFFTENENKIIETFLSNITSSIENCFLITGYPSTGKTITTLKLTYELERKNIEVLTFSITPSINFSAFFNDLAKLDLTRKYAIIIEDIHLQLSFGSNLLEIADDYPNVKFILTSRFLSNDFRRDIEKDTDIFFQLRNNNLQLEINNTPQYFKEKIIGIIGNCKKYLSNKEIKREIGDINRVVERTKNNLYKLSWFLYYWSENDIELSSIDDDSIQTFIHRKYLVKLSNEEKVLITQFASLYSFEIEFETESSQINIAKQLGLVYRNEGNFHQFMHSKFADLLVDSIIKETPNFRYKFNNDRNVFLLKNIENYLGSLIGDSDNYVQNIYSFLYNIGISENIKLFSQILSSEIIKGQFIKYADSSDSFDSDQLINLLQLIKIFSSKNFEEYCNALYFENKNIVSILKKGTKNVSALSYIETHRKSYAGLKSKNIFLPFSETELKEIFISSRLNNLTLSLRLLPNNEILNKALNILDSEDWKSKFKKEIHFGILGNSLAELHSIKPALASSIFKSLDVEKISSKIKGEKFDYITKTLSELRIIDYDMSFKLLNSIPIEKLVIKSKRATIEQIGIGLSRLFDISQPATKKIYSSIDKKLFIELFSESSLTVIGHVLCELNKVDNTQTQILISDLLSKDFIKSKLNSTSVTTTDLFTFYLSLSQLKQKKTAKNILNSVNREIIEGRVISSNLNHSLQLINAINEIDPDYGKELVSLVSDEKISKKIINKDTTITDIPALFVYLINIDKPNAKRIYNLIDNYEIIKKCLVLRFRIQPIFNSLMPLYSLDEKKTEELIDNLMTHRVFKSKISESDIESFINCVSIVSNISKSIANKIVEAYSSSLLTKGNNQVQFAKFSDSLLRLYRIDSDLANHLLNTFKPHLKNTNGLSFYQLKAGLCALSKVDKILANEILKEIPIDVLKKMSEILLNDKKNLEGQLGEIKCVNIKVWEILMKHLLN